VSIPIKRTINSDENKNGDHTMSGARVRDVARKLQVRLLEYGLDHLRLLLQVMRELAQLPAQAAAPELAHLLASDPREGTVQSAS
jgi:hypothetical protein